MDAFAKYIVIMEAISAKPESKDFSINICNSYQNSIVQFLAQGGIWLHYYKLLLSIIPIAAVCEELSLGRTKGIIGTQIVRG